MNRAEYLEAARDNASDTAFSIRRKERKLPFSQRGRLRAKRMKLLDDAAEYQSQLIVIDARHATVGRPNAADKNRMATLRNSVRVSMKANLGASALIALAGDVLDVIEDIRAV